MSQCEWFLAAVVRRRGARVGQCGTGGVRHDGQRTRLDVRAPHRDTSKHPAARPALSGLSLRPSVLYRNRGEAASERASERARAHTYMPRAARATTFGRAFTWWGDRRGRALQESNEARRQLVARRLPSCQVAPSTVSDPLYLVPDESRSHFKPIIHTRIVRRFWRSKTVCRLLYARPPITDVAFNDQPDDNEINNGESRSVAIVRLRSVVRFRFD